MFNFLFFRRNNKPRNWVQFLFFSKDYSLRWPYKILKIEKYIVNNKIKDWYDAVLVNPYPASAWATNKGAHIRMHDFSKVKSISIVGPPATYFVVNYIKSLLAGVKADIRISENINHDSDLYFIICPQVFKELPPPAKRISVQMEQTISSRWFTREYLGILQNSLATIDYSKVNLKYLSSLKAPISNIIYIPIRPMSSAAINFHDRKKVYDVLFYGDYKVRRRKKFLAAISKKFNLKIVSGVYGEDLWPLLCSAKVIVNIHYYENALLETTRISECLTLGLRVVSEEGSDQSDHINQFPGVSFTPINSIPAMINAIEEQLINFNGDLVCDEYTKFNVEDRKNLLQDLSEIGVCLPI
ncbi:MAG: hypothetical protein RL297_491 [Pseudomonadota bacterium]|jgi:hypothetical protein